VSRKEERETEGVDERRQPRNGALENGGTFIKVMADYFNIPMGVRAPFVVSCQFNNPRPGDPFLAGVIISRLDARSVPRSIHKRRMNLSIYSEKHRVRAVRTCHIAPRNSTRSSRESMSMSRA